MCSNPHDPKKAQITKIFLELTYPNDLIECFRTLSLTYLIRIFMYPRYLRSWISIHITQEIDAGAPIHLNTVWTRPKPRSVSYVQSFRVFALPHIIVDLELDKMSHVSERNEKRCHIKY
jgi:hypothetical protein